MIITRLKYKNANSNNYYHDYMIEYESFYLYY